MSKKSDTNISLTRKDVNEVELLKGVINRGVA
jgi:hypothetical protein